jgi:hypothetical protein
MVVNQLRNGSSIQSRKRTRLVKTPTTNVTVDDFSVLASPHPYGILPSGNRLFQASSSSHESGEAPTRLLPDEYWFSVLEFCDGESLARLSQSCRTFYAMSHEPSLWRDLVLKRAETITKAGPSWKDSFVRMHAAEDQPLVLHRPMRVSGVYSDYFHRLHSCRSFAIPPQWLEKDESTGSTAVARINSVDMTIQRFGHEFEQPNRPVVIQGAAKSWRAFQRWQDPSYLLDQVKSRTFRATSGSAPLPGNFTFEAYESYCQSPVLEEAPLYLFDRTALTPSSPLWNDYMQDLQQTCPYWDPDNSLTSHDLFKVLGEGRRPDHTWLIIGPKRSGSVFHIDPNATHAWNAAIVGRKRWIFYPPGVTPPGVLPSSDGDEVALPLSLGEWLFQFWDEHTDRMDRAPQHERPIEFTAFPGDVVFVPHGWWHLVVNLDERNVAITHNYASGSNLASVLKFLREKNDQVSGCRDRAESIKPEHLYEEFLVALRAKYPDLTEKALGENRWGCKAWTSAISSGDSVSCPESEATSVMVKAKEITSEFSFSFM